MIGDVNKQTNESKWNFLSVFHNFHLDLLFIKIGRLFGPL